MPYPDYNPYLFAAICIGWVLVLACLGAATFVFKDPVDAEDG